MMHVPTFPKESTMDGLFRVALEAVYAETGVPPSQIRGPSRIQRIAHARQRVCHILRQQGLSYPNIGMLLGIDHTTAIHACRAVERREAA